jgi:sigma-B regulation protein RsbU (phosphoserine phosphatase)
VREVSGDFYDFLEVEHGRIYFSLADVAGKGMNAALLMAKTTSLLRCLAKADPDPGRLLAKVNEEVCETASMGLFVTIVAGFIDRREKMVKFANAGHQPPLFRRSNGGYREIPAESPPLGVVPGIAFGTTELSIEDSSLYLFTDGVTECIGPDSRALGVGGLRRLIDAAASLSPQARLQHIVSELRKTGYRFNDDITLLLIEIGGRD